MAGRVGPLGSQAVALAGKGPSEERTAAVFLNGGRALLQLLGGHVAPAASGAATAASLTPLDSTPRRRPLCIEAVGWGYRSDRSGLAAILPLSISRRFLPRD